MRKIRGTDDRWNSFIAGSLAGTSLLIDSKSRRIAIALYLSTRSAQCFYNAMIDRGLVPSFTHGNTLLMGVLNMQIIYSFLCVPDTLSKPYYEWIYNLCDRQFFFGSAMARTVMSCLANLSQGNPVSAEVMRPILEKSRSVYNLSQASNGTLGFLNRFVEKCVGYSTEQTTVMSDLSLVDNPLVPHKYVFCAMVHPDSTSCTWSSVKYAFRCFPNALRMYLPLNSFMMLVFRHSLLTSK